MTKAYSYIRFSSAQQSSGDSLRRQTVAAQVYAAEHKLTLDTSLNMHDLGVSAFKGKNIVEGALGQFIAAVDDGRVEKNSFLLVEHLDRLSRLPVMDALHIFQEIINRGISIVTLRDKVVYSKQNLNANWTSLIIALASMSGANEESGKKSERVGEKWKNKKVEARNALKPIGNNAPLWLDYILEPAPAYIINQDRAAIIRRIFALTIAGQGKVAISKMLNAESIKSFKPPTPRRPDQTWGTSSIQKLLSNKALLGEYQPHTGRGKEREPTGAPIPGYYPVVIDESTFYQAQEAAAGRRIAGATKQTPRFNVWQGIARCGVCLGPVHLVNKGAPPKGGTYLHCYAARKGLCKAKAIRLDQSEPVFAEVLTKVDSLSLVQDSSASLSKQLSEIEGRLVEQAGKQAEFKAALKARYSTTLDDLVYECEQIIGTLNKEKEVLLLALASETITNKEDFIAKLDLVTYEGRYRANALLKRLKIKVAIYRFDDDGKAVRYLISANGKFIRAITQGADGRIVGSIAFNVDQLDKGKVQDFDGSIDSSLDMLIFERASDIVVSNHWWDDATLNGKITEMLARVGVDLATDSSDFQYIKDRLDLFRGISVTEAQELLAKTERWLDSLDD